jgi:hypothetical protein
MERETERILKDSDVHLNWILREDAVAKEFSDLVVLRFKGDCGLQPSSGKQADVGTLAFTYTTDGVVQPFSGMVAPAFSVPGIFSSGTTLNHRKSAVVVAKEQSPAHRRSW